MNFSDVKYLLYKEYNFSAERLNQISPEVYGRADQQLCWQVRRQIRPQIFNEEKARLKKRATNDL